MCIYLSHLVIFAEIGAVPLIVIMLLVNVYLSYKTRNGLSGSFICRCQQIYLSTNCHDTVWNIYVLYIFITCVYFPFLIILKPLFMSSHSTAFLMVPLPLYTCQIIMLRVEPPCYYALTF